MLTRDLVSEPIALELRQDTGNVYLHAQLFAGFMYVGAAICMFFLRAWKIGQLEELAAELEKTPGEVNVLSTESAGGSGRPLPARSSIVKRLVAWRRV